MCRRRPNAFTLIELLVVIGVIGTLMGLLLPAVRYGRAIAQSTKCAHNLGQFGHALELYIEGCGGFIPRRGQGVQKLGVIDRGDDWFNCLLPYVELPAYSDLIAQGKRPVEGEQSVLICPVAIDPGWTYFLPYAMNMYLSPWIRPANHNFDEIQAPNTLVFMADAPGPYSATVPSRKDYGVPARHSGKANLVFVDGHVASFAGTYLGCGAGDPSRPDVRWQTGTQGINQPPLE